MEKINSKDQQGSAAFTAQAQDRTVKSRNPHKSARKCDSQTNDTYELPHRNHHRSYSTDYYPRTDAQRIPLINFVTLPQPKPPAMPNTAAAAAGMKPLPETVLHSSKQLTHREAHTMLSDFLKKAEVDAAYRPDSTLTERGPQSASTGANSNLTLHHLSRILKGIEGKHLGPDQDIGKFFGDGADKKAGGSKKTTRNDGPGGGADGATETVAAVASSPPAGRNAKRKDFDDQHYEDGNNAVGVAVAGEVDGWQGKEDYELAQREGGLELLGDDKQSGMSLAQPASRKVAEDAMAVDVHDMKGANTGAAGGVVDKKARREAKKARHKAEKKQQQREAKKKD